MRRTFFWLALLPAASQATIHYALHPNVVDGSLAVSVTVDAPKAVETFEIPGWSPGYYVMANYQDKIFDVHAASADGKPLTVSHAEVRGWKVASDGSGPITLSYSVRGNDPGLGFFGASVNQTSAYTNGPASYMYVLGRRTENTSLKVDVPEGWRAACALDKDSAGYFTAADYDELADSPVQMGKFVERDFTVAGIPFEALFVIPPGQQQQLDADETTEILRKVSQPAIKLFGGTPFKRYFYIFHLTEAGFQGGLEHRNGTVLAVPNRPNDDMADLACHEFFHAWNVKQIRPKPLGPFDYTQPARTGNLWFAEGVTDYYSKILTYRSGVQDISWLTYELSDQVGQFQEGRTRHTKTVEDASQAVWENQGFNLGDLDYYNKGLLAGLLFDCAIRTSTNGKKSLDDVMRLMYGQYRLPQPGYGEDGILQAINAVAGKDLTPLYKSMIRSTQELPYSLLAGIGLEVTAPNQAEKVAQPGWPLPVAVGRRSAAGGLDILPEDNFVSFSVIDADTTHLRVERKGKILQFSVHVKTVKSDSYKVEPDPLPSKAAAQRFLEWTARPNALPPNPKT